LLVASLIGSLTLIVLLVTCANIGNLVLSRAIGRIRELGVRAALGASRWRIVRQQLVESLLVASLGAIAGLFLSNWALRTLAAYASLPLYLNLAPDGRTFIAGAAIASLSTLVFGILPAWIVSRRDLIGVMKEGGYTASRSLARTRLRLVLIGAQVMGSCVLLVVSGLVARGMQRLLAADLGFDFEQVVVMEASPRQYGVQGPAARLYWEDVKRSIESSPNVELVALATQAPLGDSVSTSYYRDAQALAVTTVNVEPSFFELMRIPLVAGRNFQPDDPAATVVIISRRLATEMYGTLDIIGKGFPKSGAERTIIGITEDAALMDPAASTVAEQYMPIDRDRYGDVLLMARARGNPAQLLQPMRDAARAADNRVVPAVTLMRESYERKLHARRSASLVVGAAGLLALTLACFGIFGVVVYGVAMRTREIGIRRALGANAPSIVGLVLGQLLVPVSTGMLLGTAAGLAVGTVLARQPFYLPASDIFTPVLVLLFFALTATAAAIVPATRALGVEPLRALRHD
jgi:predicted permease